MVGLGVVLDACIMLHIRDPQEFYAMPAALQNLWTEHAENKLVGAYFQTKKRGRQSPTEAKRIEAAALGGES